MALNLGLRVASSAACSASLNRFSTICKASASDVASGAAVPRICTLSSFAESVPSSPPAPAPVLETLDEAASALPIDPSRMDASSRLRVLLAETVVASEQAQDVETISGRLAMICFAAALSLEVFADSGVYSLNHQTIDPNLASALPALAVAAAGVVAFGAAKKVERKAAELLASGYRGMLDSVVDGMVQGLLVDDPSVSAWSSGSKDSKREN